MNEKVLTKIENGKFTIIINRPDDENRIDMETTALMDKALMEANKNKDIRVVIITGNKDYFCSGGRVYPEYTAEDKQKYTETIKSLQKTMLETNIPIIAALEGTCRAGGNDILASADIAVAADDITFSFPEILHGGFPAMVMVKVMDLMPKKKLLPLFYTGSSITAQEAENMGIITCAVSREKFWDTVNYYADEICSKNEILIRLGRKTYFDMLTMNTQERTQCASEFLGKVLDEQLKK